MTESEQTQLLVAQKMLIMDMAMTDLQKKLESIDERTKSLENSMPNFHSDIDSIK